jgi:hypothetical protein
MDGTSSATGSGAPPWPALSAADLERLRFFAYLRRMGRLRPAAAVDASVDALCMALLREPPAPRVRGSGPSHGGLPPIWQAWAEKQRQRGAHAR